MNIIRKAIFLAGAVLLTAISFSSVASEPAPTAVTPNMIAATMPVCKRAVEAYRTGDPHYLQRTISRLPPGSQGLVFILCTAYAQGYVDGRNSFPQA